MNWLESVGRGLAQLNHGWNPEAIALAVVGVVGVLAMAMLWRAARRVRAQVEDIRGQNALHAALRDRGEFCVINTDSAGRILYINPAAQKQLGYEANELLGQPIDLVAAPTDGAPLLTASMAERVRAGQRTAIASQHVVAIRKDQSEFPAAIDLVPAEYEGHWQFVVSLRDESARQSAQQARDLLEAELEQVRNAADADRRATSERLIKMGQQVSELKRAKEAAETADQAKFESLAKMRRELQEQQQLAADLRRATAAAQSAERAGGETIAALQQQMEQLKQLEAELRQSVESARADARAASERAAMLEHETNRQGQAIEELTRGAQTAVAADQANSQALSQLRQELARRDQLEAELQTGRQSAEAASREKEQMLWKLRQEIAQLKQNEATVHEARQAADRAHAADTAAMAGEIAQLKRTASELKLARESAESAARAGDDAATKMGEEIRQLKHARERTEADSHAKEELLAKLRRDIAQLKRNEAKFADARTAGDRAHAEAVTATAAEIAQLRQTVTDLQSGKDSADAAVRVAQASLAKTAREMSVLRQAHHSAGAGKSPIGEPPPIAQPPIAQPEHHGRRPSRRTTRVA